MRSSIPLLHFPPSHLLARTEDLLACPEKGSPAPAGIPIRVLLSENMRPGTFALVDTRQVEAALAKALAERGS